MGKILLKKLTRFGFGGEARELVVARTENSITSALRKPYYILGDGTNVIASDKGFKGRVVKVATSGLEIKKNKILCEAGVKLQKLVDTANKNGLEGLETLAGIPGTVGGAIFGTAGAYGKEISDNLKRVKIFDGSQARWIPKKSCAFSYRESVFSAKGGSASGGKTNPWVILAAEFRFKKSGPKQLIKKSKEIVRVREKKYRPNLRCAGSIFKNIVVEGGKIPAGSLLESVGAKEMRIGGVYGAPYHANLLINNGRGKAADAKKLINILKNKVYKKYGIRLEEEVRYLGF